MKIFGFTVEYYAKTHLFSKCNGNDSVPTITLKLVTGTITKRKNVLLFRSTDERASCLIEPLKYFSKTNYSCITSRRCHMKDN